jgi:hypothetical protein
MDRTFTVALRDYESGFDPDRLTTERIERVIQKMLDKDMSDGYVVVTEVEQVASNG